MGTVLVSLDEEHEAFLRRIAQEKGGKKGVISEVVQEALNELKQKDKKERARKQFLQTIEKGINLGFKGKVYENRDEIYD